jgi:hypothetical protein
MMRTKSGLPKHCGWNLYRENGTWRVRFRKGRFSVYLTGTPRSDDFMRHTLRRGQGVGDRYRRRAH